MFPSIQLASEAYGWLAKKRLTDPMPGISGIVGEETGERAEKLCNNFLRSAAAAP
jgi:hypothetical protein